MSRGVNAAEGALAENARDIHVELAHSNRLGMIEVEVLGYPGRHASAICCTVLVQGPYVNDLSSSCGGLHLELKPEQLNWNWTKEKQAENATCRPSAHVT